MAPHHRVRKLGQGLGPGLDLHRSQVLAVGIVTLWTVGTARAVDRLLAFEQGLHPLGQRLEREVLVGEQGVAAKRRQLAGVQQGVAGRGFEEAPVAVPPATEVQAFDFVGLFDHRNHVGMGGISLDKRLQAESPQSRGEAGQLPIV